MKKSFSSGLSRRLVLQGVSSAITVLFMNGCASTKWMGSMPQRDTVVPEPVDGLNPTLRVIAPAGLLQDTKRVERALARFSQSGFVVQNQEALWRRYQHFAGTDDERLADLNVLATTSQPMPNILIATRGGYGAMRLLDRIDYARLCPRLITAGSLLFGYSDTTALQLALLARGGVITFSGPMLNSDFGSSTLSTFTMEGFRRLVTQSVLTVTVDLPQVTVCQEEGVLWGGNLSVLTQLVGTPWLPMIKGGILFLEDVGEALYRIERLLLQLYYAGILAQQKAILIGSITQYKPDTYAPQDYTLDAVLNALRQRLTVPILTGLPIGHVPDIISLPIGAHAQLSCTRQGYTLTVQGYPTLGKRMAAINWSAFDLK